MVHIPHSLESLMWIFPTGCYDICPESGYLIGPRGDYNYHEWQHFGTSQQSGSGIIYPYWPNQAGNYQLMMDNGSCQFTSGIMTLNPNPDCGVEYECKLKGHIEGVRGKNSPYMVYGILHNYGSTSITLTISSGNNSGVYYPATVTIPAGGSYDFMTNPLLFYPSPGFGGGGASIMFTGINCEFKTEISFPEMYSRPAVYAGAEKATVTIAPNPARQLTTVTFHTGNKERTASMLLVHDAMGNVKFRKNLDAAEGRVSIDTTPWLQGVYIVTVVTPDRPLQGKLLKE